MIGILAFTSLTTIDVVVAKLALSDHEAGVYGAASLVGRLILYLPSAIAAVLLPKVSSRTAMGRSSGDILIRSAFATGVLCILSTAVLALAPTAVMNAAFGSKYDEGAPLLWLFGLAMTGYALLNVLFVYDIARHGWRAASMLGIGAVCQIVGYGLVHSSGRALLAVSIVSAYTLVLVGSLLLHRDRVLEGARLVASKATASR